MLPHRLTTCVTLLILFQAESTTSPEWEADLLLLRKAATLGIAFEPSKRRRILTQAPNTDDLLAAAAPLRLPTSPEDRVTRTESFYELLVHEIASMNMTHVRSESGESNVFGRSFEHEVAWPRTVPPPFRLSYIDIVRFDRNYEGFAPNLQSTTLTERIPRWGIVSLDETIVSATETAVVFPIHQSDKLIKYQCDCHDLSIGDVHPILLDWWFLKYLEHLGISPRAYYVSPPSSVVGFDPTKTVKLRQIRTKSKGWQLCQIAPAGTVRFLVMQQAGQSLHRTMAASPNQRISLNRVITLGISSIKAIRTLHDEAGVIHGDIHAGNICIHPVHMDEVMLIDFGKSFFVNPITQDEQIRKPFSWVHALFSPWDILGKQPGKRDDVFKILLTMSLVLNGHMFMEYLTRIESNTTLSFEWKQDRNFFISPFYDFRGDVPSTSGYEIVGILDEILAAVRGIPTVSDRPPYEKIIERLEKIQSILTDRRTRAIAGGASGVLEHSSETFGQSSGLVKI